MKKLLFSLLLLNILTVHVHGQDYTDDGDYSISLNYTRAPSYTVKLPQVVDVSNENTIMTFYVKGDIYGDQSLRVIFDHSAILSYNDETISLSVTQTKDSWSYNELSDSYTGSSISISHAKLRAGTWAGYLNVAISLQGGL